MIGVLGVKTEVKLDIREKLSIIPKRYGKSLIKLKEKCDEVVILSTCNRTEVYYRCKDNNENIVLDIFKALNWDENYKKYTFQYKNDEAINHLMRVICGFDSLILGEDQILGQIKEAYEIALKSKSINKELNKLFQMAITCGKEFRNESKLYKIPVSSASIAVNEGRKHGGKNFMVLGYGAVGSLAVKYILSGNFNKLYIVVRNPSVVDLEDDRIKIINFNERGNYYKDVDCIISCTSAPHIVVDAFKLPQNKNMILYDLAVPRDIDEEVRYMKNAKLYDIDDISCINDKNCSKREDIMNNNLFITEKYEKEFKEWEKISEISQYIGNLKKKGDEVYKKRLNTFKNKKNTKDVEALAETMLKSTSNAYINKAIEVLKEEQLKGRGDECLKIIEKIFYSAQ